MTALKNWLIAAGIRAAKAAAEGALAAMGASTMLISDINWVAVASGAAIGAITSVLFSIKGIPEVDNGAALPAIVSNDTKSTD